MFKLFALSAALLCSQVFAQPRDGIYIGAGVGATFDHGEVTGKNTITDFKVKVKNDRSQAIGNVFVGYGHTLDNCFFLGLEGGTYFPHRNISVRRPGVTITTTVFTNNLRVQDYFVGDFLPGYRVCPDILIYARGGFNVAHLVLEQETSFEAGVPRYKNSETKCGGRAGLGVAYSFSERVALALDYVYSWYPKITTDISGFTTVVTGQAHANYVGVSFIYNFSLGCN